MPLSQEVGRAEFVAALSATRLATKPFGLHSHGLAGHRAIVMTPVGVAGDGG